MHADLAHSMPLWYKPAITRREHVKSRADVKSQVPHVRVNRDIMIQKQLRNGNGKQYRYILPTLLSLSYTPQT